MQKILKSIVMLILLIIVISGCKIKTTNLDNNDNTSEAIVCSSLSIDDCTDECVVCPPCPACSSISCQTEEFCKDMGINRTWYEDIKSRLNNPAQALQGIWTSTEDDKYTVEFKDETKIDYYNNEITSQADFSLEQKPDGQYLKVSDDEDILEYKIITLTNTSLELIYLSRGNTLYFEK